MLAILDSIYSLNSDMSRCSLIVNNLTKYHLYQLIGYSLGVLAGSTFSKRGIASVSNYTSCNF